MVSSDKSKVAVSTGNELVYCYYFELFKNFFDNMKMDGTLSREKNITRFKVVIILCHRNLASMLPRHLA